MISKKFVQANWTKTYCFDHSVTTYTVFKRKRAVELDWFNLSPAQLSLDRGFSQISSKSAQLLLKIALFQISF
jgi:hypothetical protein